MGIKWVYAFLCIHLHRSKNNLKVNGNILGKRHNRWQVSFYPVNFFLFKFCTFVFMESNNNNQEKTEKKEKNVGKLPKDEFPSVFTSLEQRNSIIGHLPLTKFRKIKKNLRVYNTITGTNGY